MSATRPRVLVIEDDPVYVRLLRLNLEASDYRVMQAGDASSALAALGRFEPDAIILDVMLPGVDGYELCRRIRQDSDVPIIMLTAKAEEQHKIHGLLLGADDYVTKPFSAPELLARLTSVLRRSRQREDAAAPPPLQVDGLVIDFAAHRVVDSGQEVPLTRTEFKLLVALASHHNRVMLADELLHRVWGSGYEGDVSLLRTTVRRLRCKLGREAGPGYIRNVRGVGYTFQIVRASRASPGTLPRRRRARTRSR